MILYHALTRCRFLYRVNRFLAVCEAEGAEISVHVKNTGRLRELLLPGASVYLEKSQNPARKTAYDLVAVESGGRIVNIDSQAPNPVAAEWIAKGGWGGNVQDLRREVSFRDSRFDLSFILDGENWLAEVKGVTLFDGEGTAYFPDAPTERGVRHLQCLAQAAREGMKTGVLFVLQREDVLRMKPNAVNHPAFADALREAAGAGVRIVAAVCRVAPEGMEITHAVPVILSDSMF